ncbi:Crp/Fnr family transcriptional regulator [Listeria riparia]|uniref:Cyclic nucleotide-binding domain-containing protein n=1 Tax=Listeria riparia FSL S10-1204 TaxID=1265816 RepID=W7DD31_9LIST|nr:Crp/Fnr family transcriptional regulator [Listeria riparia]EUJ45401.1 cyclic nucleotide-binding domain-containing protein [Listeria riparia FSL S10-1204]
MLQTFGVEIDENFLEILLFSNKSFDKYSKKKVLPAKTVIDASVTENRSFIYIEKGVTKIVASHNTKETTISFSGDGEFIGFASLLSRGSSQFALETISETTAYFIDPYFVLNVIDESGWGTSILLKIIENLTQSVNYYGQFNLLPAKAKVAAALLHLESKNLGKGEGQLPKEICQHHLASYCQITREYATTILSKFEEDGLVKLTPKPITILDIYALKQMVGFEVAGSLH